MVIRLLQTLAVATLASVAAASDTTITLVPESLPALQNPADVTQARDQPAVHAPAPAADPNALVLPAAALAEITSTSPACSDVLCGNAIDCGDACAVGAACPSRLASIPGMIGDYFGGYGAPIAGPFAADRLMVLANDLDAPGILPGPGATLTITEAAPTPIVSGATNIQQLQALLRAGAALPTLTGEGNVADNATLTTTLTISQMQALLASTPEAFDVIPLAAPPASYDAAVAALFAARNTVPGTSTYDAAGSGALLQAGDDALTGGEDFDALYFYAYLVDVGIPTPGAAFGNMGRLKVADGNSAMPRDRVYFRYSMIDGVAGPVGDVGLDRFTPGFEKTFADGAMSLELRTPFAATASNVGSLGPGGFVGSDVLFGDLTMFAKALLLERSNYALAGGLGVTVPTADDVRVTLADGTPLVAINHESVHFKPFLAGLYAPPSGWFVHSFLELDVDANGDSVDANLGNGLTSVGTLSDATYLFTDLGVGYRILRPAGLITAIAPTCELHYNAALDEADSVQAGFARIGGLGDDLDIVNATAGATLQFGSAVNASAGYIVPLGGGLDRQLDAGFRVCLEYCPR